MADSLEVELQWQAARLIPATGIRGEKDQEQRATSALMAVMSAVPDLAKSLLAPFRVPAGRARTYVEPQLRDDDGKIQIPDAAIVIERGKRRWTCLVEVKTGRTGLDQAQVDRCMALASQYHLDAVLTVSNQIAAVEGECPIEVDRRRLKTVSLRHLSWFRILTAAIVQHRHHGVSDPEQAWILDELIHYLSDPRSGVSSFDDMGSNWVGVREATRNQTIRPTDSGVRDVAARWEEFVQFLCLGLCQELGREVEPFHSQGSDTRTRQVEAVNALVEKGALEAKIKIPDAVAPVTITADLRARQVTILSSIQAPREGKPKTRINWLLRQLKDAPESLRIDVSFGRTREITSRLLGAARGAPESLLSPTDPKREPKSFTIALARDMGIKRGSGRGSFIDECRGQLIDFYRDALQDIQAWTARAPKLPDKPDDVGSVDEAKQAASPGMLDEPAASDPLPTTPTDELAAAEKATDPASATNEAF